MTALLYAVTAAHALVGGEGLAGRPLRRIVAGDLAAVVSDHAVAPGVSENSLWTFEHVVEALMASAAVVPARFGTVADDDELIRSMLLTRREELAATLARLAGTVEVAVRRPSAGRAPEGMSAERTGTEYLLTRLAERRFARDFKSIVDRAVGEVALASRSLPHAPDRLAYLVARSDLDAFIGRLGRIDDPGVSWTGPWPPYSFIGEETPWGRA